MSNPNRGSAEIIDITTVPIAEKGQEEWRYFCPACPEKRGKPDKEGKLYWNVRKQLGYCFKCGTSFFPENEEGTRLDKDEIEWKNAMDSLLRHYPDTIFEDVVFPTEVAFDFSELTTDLLRALKKRNPFLLSLKDCLGFRAWTGRDTGIVIPFIYRGKICKFQCRFVTRSGAPLPKDDKMKYYTSPGPKPLYSPYHIFGDFHTVGQKEELTICEGVFDAIALAIMGFPNPVAILGDKLTPLQMWDIRHLVPTTTKIYLCLDDVERSRYTQKLVKKFIPCVEETEIFATWSPFKDPEEWLVGQLKENVELREQYIARTQEWVRAFTQGDTTNGDTNE